MWAQDWRRTNLNVVNFLLNFHRSQLTNKFCIPVDNFLAIFDTLKAIFKIFERDKTHNRQCWRQISKIKSSLYPPYYAEACNELRAPSPRLSAWATQLRRSVATVANRWRLCVDLTGPGIEPQTSRTDSVSLATELTASNNV